MEWKKFFVFCHWRFYFPFISLSLWFHNVALCPSNKVWVHQVPSDANQQQYTFKSNEKKTRNPYPPPKWNTSFKFKAFFFFVLPSKSIIVCSKHTHTHPKSLWCNNINIFQIEFCLDFYLIKMKKKTARSFQFAFPPSFFRLCKKKKPIRMNEFRSKATQSMKIKTSIINKTSYNDVFSPKIFSYPELASDWDRGNSKRELLTIRDAETLLHF